MKPYKQEELFHFDYNMETRVAEHEERLVKLYGVKKLYENMPYDFAREKVHEEDSKEYIRMYERLDEGERFATCDLRVKEKDVWLRFCVYRESMHSPIVKGVVQDVSARYAYLINQFEERKKEEELRIDLEFEAAHLMRAVNDAYDMFFIVNLTKNSYRMINHEKFINHGMKDEGVFDELITFGVNNVPEEYKELFYNHFSREALLKAFAEGKKDVYLEYKHLGDDGEAYWVYTHVLLVENSLNNDVMEITLTHNIDERYRRETEQKEMMENAVRAAEAANNAKSEFLSRMSHDIRTPMNAIQGFVQILKRNVHDEKVILEVIDKIERSSDTLSKLLGDVLELSRIESGKVDVNYSILDLEEYAQRLRNMFEHELTNNQIEFVLESDIKKPFVWVDELKLTQICMNMLSNAKKFTPSGGKITFSIHQSRSEIAGYAMYRFTVKDTGIGMSEEFQKRAFEQFEREKSATDSGIMGSGLGMAIIKKMTELMGGRCELHSELGKGTEVSVVLRLQIATNARKKKNKDYTKIDFAGKRILLAEDNDFNREIAHFVLSDMGFEVEDAEDGSVAVDKVLNAPEEHYDLILMDIQMPNMDGYTATREIRRIPREKIAKLPIIAMTANAFQEDEDKCMEAGMDGHVAKPIDANVLVEKLLKVL